jgi:hypothetical protein
MNVGVGLQNVSTSFTSECHAHVILRAGLIWITVSLRQLIHSTKSPVTFVVMNGEAGIPVSIGIRLRAGRMGFDSREGQEFSVLRHRVHTASSRIHPTIFQMPTGVLCLGVKRRGVKLTTYLHLLPRFKMRRAVLPFPYI